MTKLCRFRAWLSVAALLLAGACAGPAPVADSAPTAAVPLVWPKAPEQARIRYLRSVTGPRDWGITRSFFRRLADALSGRDEEIFQRPGAVAERDGVLYVADPEAQALWILDAPRSRTVRVPPFDAAQVEHALRRLRIAPLLDGVRGEPARLTWRLSAAARSRSAR